MTVESLAKLTVPLSVAELEDPQVVVPALMAS
jgi:hypothetical protein